MIDMPTLTADMRFGMELAARVIGAAVDYRCSCVRWEKHCHYCAGDDVQAHYPYGHPEHERACPLYLMAAIRKASGQERGGSDRVAERAAGIRGAEQGERGQGVNYLVKYENRCGDHVAIVVQADSVGNAKERAFRAKELIEENVSDARWINCQEICEVKVDPKGPSWIPDYVVDFEVFGHELMGGERRY